MKYSKSFLVMFLIITSIQASSQISLPKEFKCIVSKDHYRDNYFTDGSFKFHSDAWGRDVENGTDMKSLLEKQYGNKLKFLKTKDGLYWATGLYKGEYKYIILVPESLVSVMVSSNRKGEEFSYYSIWLLKQVREKRGSNADYYFTDSEGKSCSSN